MINLLPVENKQSFRAARLNVLLIRYIIFIAVSILFMIAIFGVGYYITITDKNRAESELAELQAASAKYDKTRREAESFEKNLSTAKGILSNEIIFSELMANIAKTLPPGTVLTDFNIATESLGKPMVISAKTKDAEGGLRLKEYLERSPYFENVSIQTITNPSNNGGSGGNGGSAGEIATNYPYTVVLSATLFTQASLSQSKAAGGIQ